MKKHLLNISVICLVIIIFAVFDGCGIVAIEGMPRNPNDKSFSVEKTEVLSESPLRGKTIYWLGSSVTLGYASKNESMADFIAKRNSCLSVKEAVSGTTLADNSKNSYVQRLQNSTKFDKNASIDLFICQLSTNDVNKKNFTFVGSPSSESVKNIEEFDTKTTCGAIEYIIAYVKKTWNCPTVFFTNPYYINSNYETLVGHLNTIAQKWDTSIIHLFDDEDFNDISKKYRSYYMKDDVHPRRAGYLLWWTPYFENILYSMF